MIDGRRLSRVHGTHSYMVGAILLGAAAAFAGCGADEGGTDDGAPGPQDPKAAQPAGSEGGVPQPPGSTPLRRLSRVEYVNTVADLLGVTGVATDGIVDSASSEFDNSGDTFSITVPRVEEYLLLAEALANKVDVISLTACDAAQKTEFGCVTAFVKSFGARALRRPVDDAEVQSYVELFTATRGENDYATSLRTVLTRMLVAPSFLYHVELGGPAPADGSSPNVTAYELASRVSYLLWESMPDDALFAAADAGRLGAVEDVRPHVARLLESPRAHTTLRRFHAQWLGLDALRTETKDAVLYPSFRNAQADVLEGTLRFVDDVLWNGAGDVTSLLTAPYTFANANVAANYGWQAAGSDFTRVALDGAKHSGVLTQPAFLAALGKADRSAPILRGVFVLRRLLCQPPPPPPAGASTIPPNQPAAATTRQFFANLTSPASCQGCHSIIDPIGWGFENFDGIGAWRDTENGVPVDASGEIKSGDTTGAFTGAVALGKKLATSPAVRACLVKQWLEYGYARVPAPGDQPMVDAVTKSLEAAGGKVLSIPQAITETEPFYRLHYTSGVAQ